MRKKSYKDKIAKDNAWRRISETLKSTEEDCRKRWRNIRDAYKKSKKKTTTGSAAKKSKYNNNDHLKFLDASLTERDSSHCTLDNDDDQKENVEQIFNIDESASSPFLGSGDENVCQDKTNSSTASNEKIRRRTLSQENESNENAQFDFATTIQSPKEGLIGNENKASAVETKPKHPIFTFFESLAKTVSQFPPDIIARTRSKAAQIVTDMELESIARSSKIPANNPYAMTLIEIDENSSTSNCYSVVSPHHSAADNIKTPENIIYP
ncbi:unnamed protein product [Ceutorhynchus assimilis]|uniref:MADF domain-containing protein n=1 Tax=Ceutorhynchus assimilis TaxID=467358 RepID=A0A9N9MC75_9CUCU|nr:unnamed protein product [Ceutorhynchus assimilis]